VLVATTQTCQHHWLLSEPRQGIVPGVCKLCGTHREYPARLEQTDRFFDHQELIVQTQVLEPIYKTPAEERPD
jgi:hypothetical protein